MDGLRHTWNAVADLNPLSLPAISKEGMENKEKEGMENSGGASIFYIFLQIICSILFLYASYIIVKCYCGNYMHVIVANTALCCSPLCTIPYLFYEHFSIGCGKGRIGKP